MNWDYNNICRVYFFNASDLRLYMVGMYVHPHDISQLFYFTPGKYCDYICLTIARAQKNYK